MCRSPTLTCWEGFAVGAAAQDGLDAGEQFVDVEGFTQVIVRSEPEAKDLIGVEATGGQHDDRRADVVLAQPLADFQPAHARQHQIEDDHLQSRLVAEFEGSAAIAGEPDGVALRFEGLAQHLGQGLIVLNDQNGVAHRGSLR